jgi:hypothetical protein
MTRRFPIRGRLSRATAAIAIGTTVAVSSLGLSAANATGDPPTEIRPVLYIGNYGTANPLVVEAVWEEQASGSCGGAEYYVAERAQLSQVQASRIYVMKVKVRYLMVKGYMFGGTYDLASDGANRFHASDFPDGVISDQHNWTVRTWTLDKWIPTSQGGFILHKTVVPTDDPTDTGGIIACGATFDGRFTYPH